MNVFTDFHHASLLNSLIMLFEGRLGGNVYRPIGMDWHTEGFWAVYDHPATALQFLTTDQGYRPADGSPPLNLIQEIGWNGHQLTNPFQEFGVYYCRDIDSGQVNKAITLETFKQMDIDIVIASIPAHVERFKQLIARYKPNAKLIYQIGNAWTVEAATAPNVMASAIIHDVPPEVNFIQYHQEFDLNVFRPNSPAGLMEGKNIFSFINVLDHFPDWPTFLELENRMPGWDFKSFGGQCRDGAIGPAAALADKMRQARFFFHLKAGGDGYGHVIFNSAAVGRPAIVKKSYYHDKLAEALLIPDVTCINIDNLEIGEVIEKIEHFSQPDVYMQMCENVYANFKKVVDFDQEFEQIKGFLSCLK